MERYKIVRKREYHVRRKNLLVVRENRLPFLERKGAEVVGEILDGFNHSYIFGSNQIKGIGEFTPSKKAARFRLRELARKYGYNPGMAADEELRDRILKYVTVPDGVVEGNLHCIEVLNRPKGQQLRSLFLDPISFYFCPNEEVALEGDHLYDGHVWLGEITSGEWLALREGYKLRMQKVGKLRVEREVLETYGLRIMLKGRKAEEWFAHSR